MIKRSTKLCLLRNYKPATRWTFHELEDYARLDKRACTLSEFIACAVVLAVVIVGLLAGR